jgi:predicted HicB family RNase H-like nuclease
MIEKRQEVLRSANDIYSKNAPWGNFYREVFGVGGIVRTAFPNPDSLAEFEQSEEFQHIQKMLAQLREKEGEAADDGKEPTRVITVRLPKSLHEALRAEAYDRQTSMNKLCITKLLQVIEDELVSQDAAAQQK